MNSGFEADSVAHPPHRPGLPESVMNHILQQAIAEIVGPIEALSLGPNYAIAGLSRELELRFGQQAGGGIAFRIGSTCFTRLMRSIGDRAGLTQPAFRLLPLPLRLRQGLLALRGLLADFGGRGARVDEQNGRLFWRLPDCPICAGRRTSGPDCLFMSGMLKEAMSWLSGGRNFDVREISCRGRGDDDCIFMIQPIPMDS